ncbi:hypothetical protein ACFL0M_15585 [Thermodesulfobacteriota bacterium]
MAARPNKKIRQRKAIAIWIVLMAIFITEMLAYTWSRVQCVRFGYDISATIDHQRDLQLLQNNLKIESARLKSPERIAKIAKDRLGLRIPRPEQMIIIP